MDGDTTPTLPQRREALANALHSAAIHLLRRVRQHDPQSGLSAARLSALSVIVYGGPITVSALAHAEQVQLPTISRLVSSLQHEGLVERDVDTGDRRVVRIRATDEGRGVLEEARRRRIADLAAALGDLSREDFENLERAAQVLDRLSR